MRDNQISRRALVAAVPAIAIAGPVAAAAPQSELERLFWQWREADMHAATIADPDAWERYMAEVVWPSYDAIGDAEPTSVRDYALKVVARSSYGDSDPEVSDEAMRLAGVAKPEYQFADFPKPEPRAIEPRTSNPRFGKDTVTGAMIDFAGLLFSASACFAEETGVGDRPDAARAAAALIRQHEPNASAEDKAWLAEFRAILASV